MEERNTHIDQWLQQAAARQEQEPASLQEKQAAWAALQGMLHPRRRRWGLWLSGALLLALTGYFLLRWNGSETALRTGDGAGVEKAVDMDVKRGEKRLSGSSEGGANKGGSVKEQGLPAKEKAGARETANKGENTKGKYSRRNNVPAVDHKAGNNSGKKNTGAHVVHAQHSMHSTATLPVDHAAGGNRQFNNIAPAATVRRSTANPEATLSGNLPPTIQLRPEAGHRFNQQPAGLSIKLGGVLPQSGTYAFNLAAAYTFPLSKRWSLRPYIGGGYMAGLNQVYQHQAFYERSHGAGSGNSFWIDSIVTDFKATSAWLGEGGLQVTYHYRKWELFAGIAYQRMLKVNGRRDSVFITRADTVHLPAYQPQLFSPRRLPGSGRLGLQAGVSYRLAPQWQAGLRYNVQLQAQPAGKGFIGNAPTLPFSSWLEAEVRWYFRKKNFSGTQPSP
ncbi:hypothetical protein DLD77_06375 [Chitinophaga alhagiae]|uniref:Outer membrane protein beta-barrel domain-containing protein n=1 Tax=Chitinophaga alhagiae TaxID=2203219 RepID=A0ABN5LPN5_9BACT|nr:autotransporter outer membrane beta-barrel domain-containing protein [Chitinophaga alhagiae]AWO01341.1 hypothetical protein DLD77_06375 [Chitinophaga alhagiae]